MDSPPGDTVIDALAGQRLGHYQIVERIGRGGMAVVYKALQPTLRRHVAIKVLPAYFVHEPGFRGRFQQEAETVAQLEHPNILPIFDFGQDGDLPYIVMPLVTGGTLRDWLAQSVSLERAIQAFSRILDALEYAHTREPAIVHRDIKPTNVLMSQGDWPLLTDFGIAKIAESSLRFTGPATIVGTPEYMAPEQSRGGVVDHRVDLYGMGVLLYEVLTGQLPFRGSSALDVILQHVNDPVPPPSTLRPDLAPYWDEVIQRSMAKNPDERYPSARAMERAVLACLRQDQRGGAESRIVGRMDVRELHDSASRALAEGHWSRVISLCGQILSVDPGHEEAVHLLTEAQEELRRERASQQSLADLYQRARADVAAGRWDDAAARLDQIAALAPDYQDLASLRQHVTAGRQRQAEAATWYERGVSAFGRRDWPAAIVAFGQVVEVAPGYRDAADRLAEARQAQAAAPLAAPSVPWSSPSLAAPAATARVYVTNRLGGSVTVIDAARQAVLATATVGSGPLGIAAAPDGRRVYVANRGSNRLQVMDAASQMVLSNLPVGSGPYAVVAHPSGDRVYVSNHFSDSISVVDAVGSAVLATVRVGRKPTGVAVHPDGSRVYVACRDSHAVTIVDAERNAPIATIALPARSSPEGLAVAPDGRRVYVCALDGNALVVLDTASNALVGSARLGPGPYAVAVHPSGSPVYVTTTDSVVVVDAATNAAVGAIAVERWPRGIAITPDGRQLYVASRDAGSVQVVDTTNASVVATLPTGGGSVGVAIAAS